MIFGVLFQLSSEKEKRAFERKSVPTLQQVPTEAQPVFTFISECIKQVAYDGFVKLGDQGGFIDTSAFSINPTKPTESQALQYDYSSEFKIPYWWEMLPPDNCEKGEGCIFVSRRPNLFKEQGGISIEGQLDDYLKTNLGECLGDFESFAERKIIVELDGDILPDTRIGDKGVSVYLEMPVTITTPSAEHRLDNYLVDFKDFAFKDIYTLASTISELQANNSFLEKAAMNLITLYSGADAQIPPVGATEFGYGPGKYWIRSTVRDHIKQNILAPYVPLLQVIGTANYQPIQSPGGGPLSTTRDVLYNRGMAIPLGETTVFPELTASLSYLTIWDPYLDLNCDGEICTGQSGSTSFVILFGLQRYQFAYDLSFPALIALTQPGAFNGRGYQFQFALEANLRNNQPVSAGTTFIVPFRSPEILGTDPFSDIEARTSGVVDINVFAGRTRLGGLPIPATDVALTYICGTEQTPLGIAAKGKFQTRLPSCLNGIINAKKLDGNNGRATINSITDKDQQVNITIEAFRKVNATFKKIPFDRYVIQGEEDSVTIKWEADPEGPRFDLDDSEEATVVLKKKPAFFGEDPFTVVAQIYGNKDTAVDHCSGDPKQDNSENIDMLPGNYEAMVIVMDYSKQEILPETRKSSSQVGIEIEGLDADQEMLLTGLISPAFLGVSFAISELTEEEINLPGIEFNCTAPLIMANYQSNFTITAPELNSGNIVEFSSFTFDFENVPAQSRRVEDLQTMNFPTAFASAFKEALVPRFTRGTR